MSDKLNKEDISINMSDSFTRFILYVLLAQQESAHFGEMVKNHAVTMADTKKYRLLDGIRIAMKNSSVEFDTVLKVLTEKMPKGTAAVMATDPDILAAIGNCTVYLSRMTTERVLEIEDELLRELQK